MECWYGGLTPCLLIKAVSSAGLKLDRHQVFISRNFNILPTSLNNHTLLLLYIIRSIYRKSWEKKKRKKPIPSSPGILVKTHPPIRRQHKPRYRRRRTTAILILTLRKLRQRTSRSQVWSRCRCRRRRRGSNPLHRLHGDRLARYRRGCHCGARRRVGRHRGAV